MYKVFMSSSNQGNSKPNQNLATEEELKQLDQIKVKKKLVSYLQVSVNRVTITLFTI